MSKYEDLSSEIEQFDPPPKKNRSVITPEFVERMIRMVRLGAFEREVCKLTGVNQSTWFSFKRRNPEVAEAVSDARCDGYATHLEGLNGPGSVTGHIFYLKSNFPRHWAHPEPKAEVDDKVVDEKRIIEVRLHKEEED